MNTRSVTASWFTLLSCLIKRVIFFVYRRETVYIEFLLQSYKTILEVMFGRLNPVILFIVRLQVYCLQNENFFILYSQTKLFLAFSNEIVLIFLMVR